MIFYLLRASGAKAPVFMCALTVRLKAVPFPKPSFSSRLIVFLSGFCFLLWLVRLRAGAEFLGHGGEELFSNHVGDFGADLAGLQS
jgi:hypothetical protein